MPMPNADDAFVPLEKLTDYLLDLQHPIGGSKAVWFHGLGYHSSNKGVLEQDLLQLVHTSEDFSLKDSPFGKKYIVSGTITTPNGKKANLTTVWIIEANDSRPRLVTAIPGEKP
jgi:hypothetical protein